MTCLPSVKPARMDTPAGVKQAVEEVGQDVAAGVGAKSLLESGFGFGIDKSHGKNPWDAETSNVASGASASNARKSAGSSTIG